MFSLTARADDAGVSVLASGARAAMAAVCGDGEGAGLVVRQLATDARLRLRGGEEGNELVLDGEVRGTEFVVTLRDRGAPVSGPPDGVLAMLGAGVATAAEARTDGAGNVSEVRFALPTHNALPSMDSVEVMADDVALSPEEVTFRELRVEDTPGVALAIYRTYGWSYPNTTMYYPERVAASIESGERVGFVAVSESGEIAAHWGAWFLSPTVVETGGTVTDPRFRRRGLAKKLGEMLHDQLHEMGVRGRIREPVLTHPATQQMAIDEGATIIGAYVNQTHPTQQVGITDGLQPTRGTKSVAFTALRPLDPSTVWVPTAFEPMLRMVLDASGWPREIGAVHRDPDAPAETVLSMSFNSDNRSGTVDVSVVGVDLIDAVGAALDQMRRSGAEYAQVRLPADQPALPTVGAGLLELGLSYSCFIPGFRADDSGSGDVLVTQWIAELDVSPDAFVFAGEQVRDMVMAVIEQAEYAGSRGTVRQRRAAQRAQLFAALGD